MRAFKILCSIILLVTAPCFAAPAAGADEMPTGDEYMVLRLCEGVRRLFEVHAEMVWPGYSLAQQPFLVYVPERWALLYNSDATIEGFGERPKRWPDLGPDVLYHEGKYGDLVGQLVFDLTLGEVTTLAIGFPDDFSLSLERPQVRAFAYIVHEAFHQYQNLAFGEMPWAREEKYPISDLTNGALAYLEMRILEDALEAAAAADHERCRARVGEFVAIRRHRWTAADPFVGRYEQGKELKEGTAKYVELKCVELMSGVDYVSALDGVSTPLEEFFPPTSMPQLLLRELGERMGDGCLQPQDIPRNRIYAVAGAQGFLLDYFGIDWKHAAEEAGAGFTYVGLLEAYLGLDEPAYPRFVEQAKNGYDYGTILSCTIGAAEEYRHGYARELEAFEAQSGLRVELVIRTSGLSRSRVSRAKKWLVYDGRSCLCSKFKVYTLRGGAWMLELHDAGLLELNDWDMGYKDVIFYDTGIDSVSLDGEPVSPLVAGSQEYRSLELSGDHFTFSSAQPGELIVGEKTVRLLLD
jgi:hypothetical protein